ncbi:MAG TPA: hypothetical protein VHO47_05285 [Candidatus Babeliales bacterium]|nr:hypothetical protein [Candidatus Babeliales bacterium]
MQKIIRTFFSIVFCSAFLSTSLLHSAMLGSFLPAKISKQDQICLKNKTNSWIVYQIISDLNIIKQFDPFTYSPLINECSTIILEGALQAKSSVTEPTFDRPFFCTQETDGKSIIVRPYWGDSTSINAKLMNYDEETGLYSCDDQITRKINKTGTFLFYLQKNSKLKFVEGKDN